MGSVSLAIGDGTARFRRAPVLCSSLLPLLMLLSVVATNLLALYAFTRSPPAIADSTGSGNTTTSAGGSRLSQVSRQVSLIFREISSAQTQLSILQRDLLGFPPLNTSSSPAELRLFLSPLPLPLGPDSRTHVSHMSSSISHLCSLPLLRTFTSYAPYRTCPADHSLQSQLLSARCDPLPRRRCLAPRSPTPPRLLPLPSSLWNLTPSSPLLDRLAFVKPRGKNDFTADEVLALAPAASLRLGLDLAGSGAGNLAARMAERGLTFVTLVADAKVGGVVAARGLLPLQVTPAQRLPFHDGVFDIVHAVELDGGGGGMNGVEFLMFDVDRVLRAGGLLWLDNHWCVDEKRKAEVTALIDRFGYKKLRWVVGEKVDTAGGGKGKPKVYLSAVLEKPVRR